MQTFLAVLEDLWSFVLGNKPAATEVEEVRTPLLLTSSEEVPSFLLSAERKVELVSPAQGVKDERGYVTVGVANVFNRPVMSYDGVVQKLSYAESFYVSEYEGRFARIHAHDKNGWILKDEITSNHHDIFPDFQNGEIYSLNHPDTKKLRALISDEFFATEMFLPLQSVEFVAYKALSDGRVIPWPDVRPRTAGNWQNILKGRLGVKIGVYPKTGSFIEYQKSDGTGWVGYTKSVHVDESIVVEGVGRLIEGEYREETFTKDEWHEWRPVWISAV